MHLCAWRLPMMRMREVALNWTTGRGSSGRCGTQKVQAEISFRKVASSCCMIRDD
jgi:hypothetical protein